MNLFYAVDREKKLSQDDILYLAKYDDIEPIELKYHVNTLFPEGVSIHGNKYFLNNTSLSNLTEPAIELLFEYVRISYFSENTSRFQSFFACKALEEAKFFKNKSGDTTSPIYEIYSEKPYFKANMNLLNNGNSILGSSFLAHEYWSGKPGQDANPFWKILLSLPIKVGKRVE